MKISNSRKSHKPQPVPELIKELWNLYFKMSLDPHLEASAAHVRSAALTLEHTRRMALEVALEKLPNSIDGFEREDGCQAGEDDHSLPAVNPKFGSIMKH